MMLHHAQIRAWLMWDAAGFFEWLTKRPWYAQIFSDWVATLPIERGERAVEVGCGPGFLSAQLHQRGALVTGLDRSAAMVARARKNAPACTFVEGDALSLQMKDDEMDVAVAASVVNVVSDPKTLIGEMARVVRPGGHVSVLFPTPRLTEECGALVERRGLRGLSRGSLNFWASKAPKREPAAIEALFEEVGFKTVRVDWFFDDTVASVTGIVEAR